jgi:hypothetical protein
MGIPAWDNLNQIPDPIRKGVQVHFVASETEQHRLAAISEVANRSTGEVILQIDDPTRTYGRYTTPAPHDESKSVGTWHFIEP